MSARQINVGSTARGGTFSVQKHGAKPEEKTDRKIYLDNTVEGIEKRQDPANFADTASINKAGVHDLSASILRGSEKSIYGQLKHYDEAIVLFMPLPAESDLQIFSALARVTGMDAKVMTDMKAMLTRPVFAQASDMGTRFVDTKAGTGGEGEFSYGLSGTVIRKPKDRARRINEADLADRKLGALTYTTVAKSAITKVNEIVLACRQHRSKLFPMYARWDPTNKDFVVQTKDLKETGQRVSDGGKLTN
jgi:hypothetical protein